MVDNNHSLRGKRIIIVLGSLELGGAERQALLLARHLVNEQGADVHVWGFTGPGRTSEMCEEAGIPWRVVPVAWGGRRRSFLFDLARFGITLRRARPFAVLPFTNPPNVVCGLTWKITGASTCVWNQRDLGLQRRGTILERWAVRWTHRFVAVSEPAAGFLVDALGIPRNRVSVIHAGVELAQPESGRNAWREGLGLHERDFVACMVANMHGNKDHATLLRAWRIVQDLTRNAGRPFILLLAGRFAGTHEQLKTIAFDLGLGKTVRFLGPVKDVAGLLCAADLGVLSSRSEGCPNSVLEYMAAGLAVVATDNPGVREAVGENGYRFLAPFGDPVVWAEKILELAEDDVLRSQTGMTNPERVRLEFDPRAMCQRMVALLC